MYNLSLKNHGTKKNHIHIGVIIIFDILQRF